MPGLAFISHHHDDVAIANELASMLRVFGMQGFLAHRDLLSGAEWREELKLRLGEAKLMVAVLSPNYIVSDWTDQEVGYAVARGIPILPVSAGAVPYGFIGHIQAVRWGDEAAEGDNFLGSGRHWSRAQLAERKGNIGKALIRIGAINRPDIIASLVTSPSWDDTRALLACIGNLDDLSPSETQVLASAAASNNEVYNCTEAKQTFPAHLESRRGILDPGVIDGLVRRGLLAASPDPNASSAAVPSVGHSSERRPAG